MGHLKMEVSSCYSWWILCCISIKLQNCSIINCSKDCHSVIKLIRVLRFCSLYQQCYKVERNWSFSLSQGREGGTSLSEYWCCNDPYPCPHNLVHCWSQPDFFFDFFFWQNVQIDKSLKPGVRVTVKLHESSKESMAPHYNSKDYFDQSAS